MKRVFTILLFMFGMTGLLFSQVNLESGLLGYYKFNEIVDDTTVVNSAAGENLAPNGILKLGTPAVESGVEGDAFHFGSGAHVSLGSFNPSATNGEFSVDLWMKWDGPTVPGWHGLIGKRDGWGDSTKIYWDVSFTDGVGTVQFETHLADKIALTTPIAPPVGEWTHFTLLFDGEWALMFFDGVLVQEGLMQYGGNPEATFNIGALEPNGSNAFAGVIDELRIYDRLLSDDEITELGSGFADPTNSELSDISVSLGDLNFIRGVFNYGVAIPKGISTVNVTGSIRTPGATLLSGTGDVDVSSGTGSTTIVVVSADQSDTSSYVVDFTAVDPKLTGDIIGHESSWGDDPAHYIAAAFDGNVTTFVDAPTAEGFVGLDLGEGNSAVVTAVMYAPRPEAWATARMLGGEIRGANNADLSDAVTLFTISEEPAVNYLTAAMVDSAAAYRYIYYYSVDGYCDIAELALYGNATLATVLMHSYTFEDGTANDVVGTLHGEVMGNVTIADGKASVDTGATDQGQNYGYIKLDGAKLALGTYPAFSIETYIIAGEASNVSWTMMYYFGNDTREYIFSQMTEAGNNANVKTITAQGEKGVLYGSRIDDGAKHHIVAVVTPTSLSWFVDGELIGTAEGVGFITPIGTQFANMFRGPNGWNDNNWIGSFEEFNIYQGALDSTTIYDHAVAYLGASSAELSDITVSEGTLNFASGVTSYGVAIPKGTATVNVTGTPKFSGATVISGDGSVDVSSGSGSTTLVVVSADLSDTTTYVVNFTALDPQITSETIIGHESSWGDDPAHYIDAAFDGDISTFVDAPTADGYVGLDMGEGMVASVTAVRYAPRSGWGSRMVGGKILGSNSGDLAQADTLLTIAEEPLENYMTVAMIEAAGSYRYIYYYSPDGYCDIAELEFYGDITTGVELESNISNPTVYALEQNYPNPFNPETNIKFSLPQAGLTTLKIFNSLGQEIATLVNEKMQAGVHAVTFSAASLPSGIYFYRLQSVDFVQVKKMALLK